MARPEQPSDELASAFAVAMADVVKAARELEPFLPRDTPHIPVENLRIALARVKDLSEQLAVFA